MPRKDSPRRAALKGALVYALFGFLWILLSDRLLTSLVSNQDFVNEMQTYKGWLYILITAALVYWLIFSRMKSLHRLTTALESSEHRFRRLVDNAGDAIFLFEANGIILDANPAASRYSQYSFDELRRMHISEISKSLELHKLGEQLDALPLDQTRTFEEKHTSKNGEEVPVEVTLCAFQEQDTQLYLAMVRDATERMRNQELIVQTEKMMTVGGLAAGMAHELNNPLGVILQGVQGIKRRLSNQLPANRMAAGKTGLSLEALQEYLKQREVDSYLSAIEDAGKRSARIVRTMLDFARRDESCVGQCDLSEIIELALDLADKDFNLKKRLDFRSLNIVRDYSPGLVVQCKPGEISQVLLNLLTNAAQAMADLPPEDGVPTITITGRKQPESVRLEIADNGPGMDEQTRKRAMDPFFTTKPPGEGTGLGLSISYFIITRNHSGSMRIESAPDKGTRFIIELPFTC